MNLVQSGFECDFEMNIFINIYFKKSDKGNIYTFFNHINDVVTVNTKIEFEEKEYSGIFVFPFGNSETNKKKIKKIYGICCVRSFLDAASKIKSISIPWGVLSGIRPAKYVRELKEEGKTKEEIKKILTTIYDVKEEKADLALTVADNEEKILKRAKNKTVSIYIGIPFCPSRCLYCSFVSTDVKNSGRYMEEFVDLLCKEIAETGKILNEIGYSIQNIYIGGGTPTTLSKEQLEKIFKEINKTVDVSSLDEFTLEAGRPDTITFEKLACAKEYGVNRISINPQTLNDETLKLIGRKHTVKDFYDAYKIAREVGFDVINTDLIAGLPGETPEMFYKSVDEIVKLNPENVTVHSMYIKRAAALNFEGVELTEGKIMNDMLTYMAEKMKSIGKEPYYMYRQKNISGNLENVGYSSPDHFAYYNINIMEEIQTIVALGGGGVSKVVMGSRIERVANFKEPYEYIRRFDEIIDKKYEVKAYLEDYERNEENVF